ncbi:MAG: VIT domain-containing protein [Pseudomonadota bacterium]
MTRPSTRTRAPKTLPRLLALLAGPALLMSLAMCAHYGRGYEPESAGPPMDPAEAFAEDVPEGGDSQDGVSHKKKTRIDFDDRTIEGDLTKPDGQYLEARRRLRNEGSARRVLADLASGREELWVIAKAKPEGDVAPPDPTEPGSGELRAELENGRFVPLPLQHTDVKADIAGHIATVHVVQAYRNPYDAKIEAVYVFPLPDDAAVSEFVMVVGDRRIRGIVRERAEAEKIYREARAAGHVASLLTQERPNIFTQKVANIEPGKAIAIDITYFNALPYRDGAFVFSYPMVVGPRYNPPGYTNGVGAVPAGASGSSGQPVEVPYLRPDQRSGADLSLSVHLDAGLKIEGLASSTHAIEVQDKSEREKVVVLATKNVIPNKDFVLRYQVAGDAIKQAFLTHRDERGGFFTLMLAPPAELKRIPRTDREMIFVLDCSGSMSGVPLNKAKRAVKRVLDLMEPGDSFQIIRFSNNASALGPRPLLATRDNVKKGLRYLESLNGEGGTEMIEGIRAALDFPHQDGKLRIVSFMTDGYIGNEEQILSAVHLKLGAARIFSFGVGSSPNRYLLERMAVLGRGAVAYLGLDDDAADQEVDAFYERIAYPAMSDIRVEWGSSTVREVYPSSIPDLHVGRPVILTGRFDGDPPARLSVQGRAGGKPVQFDVVLADKAVDSRPALAQIWARTKIADLATRASYADPVIELVDGIRDTALSFGLMSPFTAFVAVDSSQITSGDHGVTVNQPVPVPEGVRYDTTVGTGGN